MAHSVDSEVQCLSGKLGYTVRDIGLDHQLNQNYFKQLINNGIAARLIPEDSTVEKLKSSLSNKLRSDPVVNTVTDSKSKFKVAKTTGDGNCFNRAISNVLTGCEDHHKTLRELTCKEIRSNLAFYEQSIPLTHHPGECPRNICSQTGPSHAGGVVKSLRFGTRLVFTPEEYVETISLPKTYSSAPEIIAMSNLLKVNIHTLVKEGNIVTIHPSFFDSEVPSPTIVMYNSGEHFQPVVDVEALNDLNLKYFCYLCNENLTSASLKKHLDTRHPFPCNTPNCFLKFNNIMRLQDHENSEHNTSGFLENIQKCNKCLDEFSKGSTLTRHLARDHNEKCFACDLSFISKVQLNAHVRRTHKHIVKPGVEKENLDGRCNAEMKESKSNKKEDSVFVNHQAEEKDKKRKRKQNKKESEKVKKEINAQEAKKSNINFENERKLFGEEVKEKITEKVKDEPVSEVEDDVSENSCQRTRDEVPRRTEQEVSETGQSEKSKNDHVTNNNKKKMTPNSKVASPKKSYSSTSSEDELRANLKVQRKDYKLLRKANKRKKHCLRSSSGSSSSNSDKKEHVRNRHYKSDKSIDSESDVRETESPEHSNNEVDKQSDFSFCEKSETEELKQKPEQSGESDDKSENDKEYPKVEPNNLKQSSEESDPEVKVKLNESSDESDTKVDPKNFKLSTEESDPEVKVKPNESSDESDTKVDPKNSEQSTEESDQEVKVKPNESSEESDTKVDTKNLKQSTEKSDSEVTVKSNEPSDASEMPRQNKRIPFKCSFRDDWVNSCKPRVDDNGDKVSAYIQKTKVTSEAFCSWCNKTFSVESRGLAQIKQHANTTLHKKRAIEVKQHQDITKIIHVKDDPAIAEIGMSYFTCRHDIAFESVDCLVRYCKRVFTDSKIAQNMRLNRTKLTYSTVHGNAVTEMNKLKEQLNTAPFCLSSDGLAKARKKRITNIVRFYDKKAKRVREQFFNAKKIERETGLNFGNVFLDEAKKDLNLKKYLVQFHADSAAPIRGKNIGALKLISKSAPMVLKTDVGGDLLHHLHNATKDCFKNSFPEAYEFLTDSRLDITTSAVKEAQFLRSCAKTGVKIKVPVSWKLYRFLDMKNALDNRTEQLPAYKDYYSQFEDTGYFQSESESETESSDSDEERAKRKNMAKRRGKRVQRMKRALSDDKYSETLLLLTSAKCNLELLHNILLQFQTQNPLIHLLHDTMVSILTAVISEVVNPCDLKDSKGRSLSPGELRKIVIETEEERDKRKKEEEISKTVKKKNKETRFVPAMSKSKVLLHRDVCTLIEQISEDQNLDSSAVRKLKNLARERRFTFNLALAKKLQYYMKVDNKFVKSLTYLCPSKIDKPESEAYIRRISGSLVELLPKSSIDDLCKEWRKIQGDKSFFDESYTRYMTEFVDKETSAVNRVRLDFVWGPIMDDSDNFPHLSVFLQACCSMFHATASIEGSVNHIRNTLGDRSHSMVDDTLNARQLLKSCVLSAGGGNGNCCQEYKYDTPLHCNNWRKSHSTMLSQKIVADSESEEDVKESKGDNTKQKRKHEHFEAEQKSKKKKGESIKPRRKPAEDKSKKKKKNHTQDKNGNRKDFNDGQKRKEKKAKRKKDEGKERIKDGKHNQDENLNEAPTKEKDWSKSFKIPKKQDQPRIDSLFKKL